MSRPKFTRRGLLTTGTVAAAVAAADIAFFSVSPALAAKKKDSLPLVETGIAPLSKAVYRLAAVQAEPVWFDLNATVAKTIVLMSQAKAQGADIIAFAELWLPGYPAFMWVGDDAYKEPLKAEYLKNSIVANSPQHRAIEEASRRLGITVVMGLSERIGDKIYMGTWIIDRGTTTHRQKKLKPSGQEWNLFHSGTEDTYAIVKSSVGNLGALSCNENRRPLLRDRFYTSSQQLHVAAWPVFSFNLGVYGMSAQCSMESSAQFAGEGGLTTIAPTQRMSEAYFKKYPLPAGSEGKITVGGGSAAIFGQDAKILTTYLKPTEEGIVYADVPRETIMRGATAYDPEPFTVPASGLHN